MPTISALNSGSDADLGHMTLTGTEKSVESTGALYNSFDFDAPTMQALANMAGIPLPRTHLDVEDRKRERRLKDTLSWLR